LLAEKHRIVKNTVQNLWHVERSELLGGTACGNTHKLLQLYTTFIASIPTRIQIRGLFQHILHIYVQDSPPAFSLFWMLLSCKSNDGQLRSAENFDSQRHQNVSPIAGTNLIYQED